jgi:hypothetical protein
MDYVESKEGLKISKYFFLVNKNPLIQKLIPGDRQFQSVE